MFVNEKERFRSSHKNTGGVQLWLYTCLSIDPEKSESIEGRQGWPAGHSLTLSEHKMLMLCWCSAEMSFTITSGCWVKGQYAYLFPFPSFLLCRLAGSRFLIGFLLGPDGRCTYSLLWSAESFESFSIRVRCGCERKTHGWNMSVGWAVRGDDAIVIVSWNNSLTSPANLSGVALWPAVMCKVLRREHWLIEF